MITVVTTEYIFTDSWSFSLKSYSSLFLVSESTNVLQSKGNLMAYFSPISILWSILECVCLACWKNTQSGHWYWAAPVFKVVENITEKLNHLTVAIHSWLFAISQESPYTKSSDYICSYVTLCSLLKMRIKLERFSCMMRMSMFSVMWQWINEDCAQLALAYV